MGYEAGNLELSIISFGDNAVNSINATSKALKGLASSVNKISNSNFISYGKNLKNVFEKTS